MLVVGAVGGETPHSAHKPPSRGVLVPVGGLVRAGGRCSWAQLLGAKPMLLPLNDSWG